MKKTVIFGAGNYGRKVLQYMTEQADFDGILFCDNDSTKQGRKIDGITVVDFAELAELEQSGQIEKIILSIWNLRLFEEAMLQCLSVGISVGKLFWYDVKNRGIRPADARYLISIYSHCGEDVALRKKFGAKKNGTYIDVGAFHPYFASNTYWAYKKGWKGINIEPNIQNYELIRHSRDRDININCGISDKAGELDYYVFESGDRNTFVKENALRLDTEGVAAIIDIRKVPVRRLDDICRQYDFYNVDFVDIDVEGLELEVLNSIDWDRLRCGCFLIEQRRMTLPEVIESDICHYMKDRGYVPANKYDKTVIYEKADSFA